MNSLDPESLAQHYVAVWTEPDPGHRRKAIEQLWTEDGGHVLHPPVEIRDAAAALGFVHPTLEARGYDELEARVTRAYDQFVAPGEYTFRVREQPVRLHDVVTFRWEMVPVGGGEAVAGGLDVFVLDDAGRVRNDFQFPDP
ncbi:MAG: hypothetical protein J2P17_00605 [Mycobacterium sp.]|nr:hypothetical protein [Mycobacterium sp.]